MKFSAYKPHSGNIIRPENPQNLTTIKSSTSIAEFRRRTVAKGMEFSPLWR
jgi:hypothetical protein